MTTVHRLTIKADQLHTGDHVIATHEGVLVVERAVPEYAHHADHHATRGKIHAAISRSIVAEENCLGLLEIDSLTDDIARAIGVQA